MGLDRIDDEIECYVANFAWQSALCTQLEVVHTDYW